MKTNHELFFLGYEQTREPAAELLRNKNEWPEKYP